MVWIGDAPAILSGTAGWGGLEGIEVHPTRARTIRADERSGLEEFIGSDFKRQAKEKTETAADSEELLVERADDIEGRDG